MDARKVENGDKEKVKQKFLLSHFLQDNHNDFLEDVEARLIGMTQASDPIKREQYWMRTLKISHSGDLNIESDY